MSDPGPRGIAADCCIETAEGAVPMSETPGKGFAVLTRLPSGQLGFRQLLKVTVTDGVPLVRVRLDSGHAALVARGQVFYRVGMEPVPAERLAPGDRLETAYRYPAGYTPREVAPEAVSTAVAVQAIEPAGEGRVLAGTIHETHTVFLTAGVLVGE